MALQRSPGLIGAMGMTFLLALACSGQPVSVTVQAGGTVMVPLTVESEMNGAVTVASYGTAHWWLDGTRFEDPQRGELVLLLDDGDGDPSNDVELVTRGVFVAEAPVESAERNLQTGFGRRLLLVADVPVDAPLGTYPLRLLHRRVVDGQTVESQPLQDAVSGDPVDYFGELKILPPSIPIQLPDGTTETAVGAASPDLLYFYNGDTIFFGQAGLGPEMAMPAQAFSIAVTFDTAAAGSGQYPGYLKLAVDYPASVIDIQKVVLAEGSQGHAWFEDDGEGQLTVHGVAFQKVNYATMGVGPIQVVFSLDDAETAVLDPADLSIEVVAAADSLGEPIDPVAWGLSVQAPEVH